MDALGKEPVPAHRKVGVVDVERPGREDRPLLFPNLVGDVGPIHERETGLRADCREFGAQPVGGLDPIPLPAVGAKHVRPRVLQVAQQGHHDPARKAVLQRLEARDDRARLFGIRDVTRFIEIVVVRDVDEDVEILPIRQQARRRRCLLAAVATDAGVYDPVGIANQSLQI